MRRFIRQQLPGTELFAPRFFSSSTTRLANGQNNKDKNVKLRLLDLGIDYTKSPSKTNYPVIREMPDFVRIKLEREKNSAKFFRAQAKLVEVRFSSYGSNLSDEDLRSIDSSIVRVDTPAKNTYPKDYFIGVPRSKVAVVIEKLRSKDGIITVNDELTSQGIEHVKRGRGFARYTVQEVKKDQTDRAKQLTSEFTDLQIDSTTPKRF
jgi:hypothetical protein